MPRNGAGVYSLPAGNPVVTLTTIASSWANTTMSDIATALTQSLATNGVSSMTGPIKAADGIVSAPGLSWAAESTSGWYRIGTNNFGFSVASNLALSVDANRAWSIGAPIAFGVALTINGIGSGSGSETLSLRSAIGLAPATPDTGQAFSIVNTSTAGGDLRLLTFGQVGADAFIRPVLAGAGPTSPGLRIITGGGGTNFGAAGNVVITAPTSGVTLALGTFAGSDGLAISSVAATRSSINIVQVAGNSSTIGQDGTQQILPGTTNGDFCIRSNQTIRISANGYVAAQITLATAGNVTIAAPSSGGAVTIQGVAGAVFTAQALTVQSPNTAGQSNGIRIIAGTNNIDFGLIITNAANTVNQWLFAGDGSQYSSGQTPQGLGTINVGGGLYIGGQPIYVGVPQNIQNASYGLVLSDANKHLLHNTGTAGHTYTIPANASVAFPVGTVITVVNPSGAGILTVAITTDTLQFYPTGATGSRTFAPNSMGTFIKIASTTWSLSGTGIS